MSREDLEEAAKKLQKVCKSAGVTARELYAILSRIEICEWDTCDNCKCESNDVQPVSDGTESGEYDCLCPKCRGDE